jgi:uncharacterized protein (DUF433 family)
MNQLEINNKPLYTEWEVSTYSRLSIEKVRFFSRPAIVEAIVKRPDPKSPLYSFNNLVAFHIIYGVSVFKEYSPEFYTKMIRDALRQEYREDPQVVAPFDHFYKVALAQINNRIVFKYFQEEKVKLPVEFRPFINFSEALKGQIPVTAYDSNISIDPSRYDGRPFLRQFDISLKAIADDFLSGSSPSSIYDKHNLPWWAIDLAIIYEIGNLEPKQPVGVWRPKVAA